MDEGVEFDTGDETNHEARTMLDMRMRGEELSDQESIMTEDIESEYRRTLINPVLSDVNSAQHPPSKKFAKVKSSQPKTSSSSRPKSRPGPSERDLVQSDDFDRHHHFENVKQVANVNVTNFDKFMVDSDLDTVKSQVVQDSFQAAMGKPGYHYAESDIGSISDAESARIEALVEKKFQEILRLTQLAEERDATPTPTRIQPPPPDSEGDDETPTSTPRAPTPSRRHQTRNTSLRTGSPSGGPIDGVDLDADERRMEREVARIRKEVDADHRKRYGKTMPASMEPGRSPSRSGAPSPARALTSTPTKMAARQTPTTQQYMNNYPAAKSSALSYKVDMEVALKLQHELNRLQEAICKSKKERLGMQGDVQSLQSVIKQHQMELSNTECKMKENSTKAEDVRTELMLAEFKRESAVKELEKLDSEIESKRVYLGELNDRVNETDNTATETEDGQSRPLSRDELLSHYSAMRHRIQQFESKERERRELETQLDKTRDSILAEQKRARQQMDSLKEELDVKDNKLEEILNERDELQKKLDQKQRDKDDVIQEKTSQFNELRAELNEQLSSERASCSKETTDLRRQLQDTAEQMAHLQSELNKKEEINLQLREEILDLRQQKSRESQSTDAIVHEHKRAMEDLKTAHEAAQVALRQEAEADKKQALDNLTSTLDQQRDKLLHQTELHLTEQLSDVQGQLTGKDIELHALKDRVKQQEMVASQLTGKVKAEAQEKLRSLVTEERARWEADRGAEVEQAVHMVRSDLERTIRGLRDELATERDLSQQHQRHMDGLKQEIEEAREQSRQAYREKLQATTAAQDAAEQDKERELELIKTKLENETRRDNERVRESLRKQEEEIARLRRERQLLEDREMEHGDEWERQDKAILAELNDECRKIAGVLGANPRVVTYPNFTWSSGQSVKSGSSTRSPLRSAITAAMSNLHSVTDDLRKLVTDLRDEIDHHKKNLTKLEKTKKEEQDGIKKKLQTEKLQALETLKDRLIKSRLGYTGFLDLVDTERVKEQKKQKMDWDREKLAQQREIERLERQVHRANSIKNGSTYGTPALTRTPTVASRPDSSFQTKPTQSGDSSLLRSKQHSGSTPDLALLNGSYTETPTKDTSPIPICFTSSNKSTPVAKRDPPRDLHSSSSSFMGVAPGNSTPSSLAMRQLELQVQRAENRAKLAEERAEKNELVLNQKLLETSKLQGSLTYQSKELMQLERAYQQLQTQQTRSPSAGRPSSRLGMTS